MANIFSDSLTFMTAALQGNAAVAITYVRGGTELSISATRGATGRQVDQLTGVISWFDQDWLIPASVLTTGDPRRGDKIVVGDSTYEVLPPDGEDCWRWSDSHETIYRIHSKRIEA